jgi:hypothetical protein
MRRIVLLLIATIAFTWNHACAAATTWYSNGAPTGDTGNTCAQNDVNHTNSIQYLHDNCASDGDTITLPAGTFVWTTQVNISKAITIQGQTTVTGDHTTTLTYTDTTILVDNITDATKGLFNTGNSNPNKVLRLTGLTFTGVGGHGDFRDNPIISFSGTSKKNRLDHCHITQINRAPVIAVYGDGVADHFVSDNHISQAQGWRIWNKVGSYGDEEFAAPAPYGTDDFWFIEDALVDNASLGSRNAAGGSDRGYGGRLVWRYNILKDVEIVDHGTYASRRRGGRCEEIYNNHYIWSGKQTTMDGITSGSTVIHDNILSGTKPRGWSLRDYRTWSNVDTVWGGAGGHNPFDINVTEVDGTHVDGHPPYVFWTDVVTASSVSDPIQTLTVAGNPWPMTNWAGYTAVANPDTPGVAGTIGQIISNTSNTLTMWYYTLGFHGFPVGSEFKIYKLFGPAVDQPGRGQGDLITGNPPMPQAWPHQALEPCYSWNNFADDGTHIDFVVPSDSTQIIQQNRDYYNYTIKPGYAPYCYPHPLVSGIPCATPTPTPCATPAAPSSLVATTISRSEIDLTWTDNANNEVAFTVERANGGNGGFPQCGSFALLATVGGVNRTSYSDTNCVSNTWYCYRVRVTNACGGSTYSNTASAKTNP